MPIQVLDIIVIAVMLLSGLLALMRGFTREVLSLISWGLAAVAGILAALNPELNELVGQYIQPPIVAKIALGSGVFLVVLIVVSLISVRLGDWVLDSAAGPFDRTLGLFYGLARGLLLVVIAYLFYVWLIPVEKREDWVREAWSLPVIDRASRVITSFLPSQIATTLNSRLNENAQAPTQVGREPVEGEETEGYKSNQTRVLDQLIESTQSGPRSEPNTPPEEAVDPEETPAFGSQTDQN